MVLILLLALGTDQGPGARATRNVKLGDDLSFEPPAANNGQLTIARSGPVLPALP